MKLTSKINYISDTLHGSIPISNLEKRIISTRIFNRLHSISQNSTAYLTFPTNRTKRFEHSLGTMHLCGQMLLYSLSNADIGVLKCFFGCCKQQLDDILQDKLTGDGNPIYRNKLGDSNQDISLKDKYVDIPVVDNLYRKAIPKAITDIGFQVLYIILYQSIRLVGMLHDLGHPPMSHITENALKTIWQIINCKKVADLNELEKYFVECMSEYSPPRRKKIVLHEAIGEKFAGICLEYVIKEYKGHETNKVLEVFFELIVMDFTLGIMGETTPFFKDLHRIVSGPLDADRFDYVSRDPINSGLDVGKIEYGRLLPTMRLIKFNDSFHFCPHVKMVDSVDDFFHRRWTLYKKIIFHHRVIKTDYLLQSCLVELALDYFEGKNISTDNTEGSSLKYDISGLWSAVNNIPDRHKFADFFLQWTDDWLLTVIKKHYYTDYKDKVSGAIVPRLEELISNKKSYYAMLKKDTDHSVIDREILKVVLDKESDIRGMLKTLNEQSREERTSVPKGLIEIPVDNFIKDLLKLLGVARDNINKTKLPALAIIRKYLFLSESDFHKLLTNAIDPVLKKCTQINDYFLVIKEGKKGAGVSGETATFYEENEDGEGVPLDYREVSDIEEILDMKTQAAIPAYIFVRKKDPEEYVNFNNILTDIGACLGQLICASIIKNLSDLVSGGR